MRVRCNVTASFIRARDPQLVTTSEVEEWLSTPGWSAWTRSAYDGHLRSFFGWFRKTGGRPDDPMLDVRRPRTQKSLPRPLTDAQVALVLASSSGRLHTWLLLGLYAGLRAHEIAKVRGEDVTDSGLYVVGKGRKQALLPVHPLILAAAEDLPRHGWWFPTHSASGHVTPGAVTGATRRLFTAHGIDGSIHRCRHSYGTNLLRNGANIRVVQKLMRHSSLATTEGYLQVADDELARAILTLGAA